MFKKILIGLVLVVALLAGYIALQPADYRVERKATIAATPTQVFEQINDFHKWEAWSPWAKLDPDAKNTFEGEASGAGAVFKWSGNDKVGEGMMKLTESKPGELIRIKLDFVKPHAASCDTEFTFKAEGDKTVVTWTMSGKNDFMSKAVCLVMNMDKMIGDDFEKGLANIKSVVEAQKK